MATLFLDLEAGNDANTGASFAQRWLTFVSGATAARIAPGDVIRIMKSPDPTSIGNATWTDNNQALTLAGALTANVTVCDSAWTASVNVTASTDASDRKQGTASATLAIAGAFTTGLVGFFAISSTDFSAYEQLSFWLKSSAAHASGVFEIRLCSDVAGLVAVDTFTVPLIGLGAIWHAFTVNKGSALGATIQSVAIYAVSDPGAVTLKIDNILACKAVGSADSISLTSILSKNTTNETWWSIRAINGTSIIFDGDSTSTAADSRPLYHGTTETVTTYKRQPIILTAPAALTTILNTITDSGNGTAGLIEFSGGWDRTAMTTQDGETWVSTPNCKGVLLSYGAQTFVKVSKFNGARIGRGLDGSGVQNQYTDGHLVAVDNIAINLTSGAPAAWRFENVFINAGMTGGAVYLVGASHYLRDVRIMNSLATAFEWGGAGMLWEGTDNRIWATNGTGINILGSQNSEGGACGRAYNVVFKRNTLSISARYGHNYLVNCDFQDASEVSSDFVIGTDVKLYSHKHDQTVDNHQIWMAGGRGASEVGADRHTASGMAWRLSPTSATRTTDWPLTLPLGQFYARASALVTVKVWVKRSNAAVSARMRVRQSQLAGMTANYDVTAAGVAGTYEEITVTFTPTEAGVFEVEAHAWGGTTHNVFWDDMTVSQA